VKLFSAPVRARILHAFSNQQCDPVDSIVDLLRYNRKSFPILNAMESHIFNSSISKVWRTPMRKVLTALPVIFSLCGVASAWADTQAQDVLTITQAGVTQTFSTPEAGGTVQAGPFTVSSFSATEIFATANIINIYLTEGGTVSDLLTQTAAPGPGPPGINTLFFYTFASMPNASLPEGTAACNGFNPPRLDTTPPFTTPNCFVPETGAVQNVTTFLGFGPNDLTVTVRSGAVPEPSSLLLLGTGVLALPLLRRIAVR
jgi:hypothetical protein